jgi:hypothetical protein
LANLSSLLDVALDCVRELRERLKRGRIEKPYVPKEKNGVNRANHIVLGLN